MRTIKKIIWKIYNKITKYEQKITDEFEYELWKRFESEYYELLVNGEYDTYKEVWNFVAGRYFHICKKLGRLEEFYRLRDSRNEDNKNTKKD